MFSVMKPTLFAEMLDFNGMLMVEVRTQLHKHFVCAQSFIPQSLNIGLLYPPGVKLCFSRYHSGHPQRVKGLFHTLNRNK